MALFAALPRTATGFAVPIGLALIGFVVITKIRAYLRLRAFDGPFSAKFSELWVFKRTIAGDLYTTALTAIEQYGGDESIARFGPNLLLTSDAHFWKSINEDRSWKKGSWYPGMALDPNHDSGFSTQDDALHDRLKNQLTRGVRRIPSRACQFKGSRAPVLWER
jgi:hypothetical protein